GGVLGRSASWVRTAVCAPLPLADVVPWSLPMASAWGATAAEAPTTDAATAATAIAFFSISLSFPGTRLLGPVPGDETHCSCLPLNRWHPEWFRRVTRM